MSKEYLEALKRIKKSHHIAITVMGCERDYETEKAIDIIEKELQRLESIDNTNPSEALKELEYLYKEAKIDSGWEVKHCITYAKQFEHNARIKPYYETIKQSLLKAQEQEKVLEIIKKKEVDTFMLMLCDNVEQYNSGLKNKPNRQLTQEEFELLKRWVG